MTSLFFKPYRAFFLWRTSFALPHFACWSYANQGLPFCSVKAVASLAETRSRFILPPTRLLSPCGSAPSSRCGSTLATDSVRLKCIYLPELSASFVPSRICAQVKHPDTLVDCSNQLRAFLSPPSGNEQPMHNHTCSQTGRQSQTHAKIHTLSNTTTHRPSYLVLTL